VFGSRKVPGAVRYLGNMLPPAVMATLVVYCLRSTYFSAAAYFRCGDGGAASSAPQHDAQRRRHRLLYAAGAAHVLKKC